MLSESQLYTTKQTSAYETIVMILKHSKEILVSEKIEALQLFLIGTIATACTPLAGVDHSPKHLTSYLEEVHF